MPGHGARVYLLGIRQRSHRVSAPDLGLRSGPSGTLTNGTEGRGPRATHAAASPDYSSGSIPTSVLLRGVKRTR